MRRGNPSNIDEALDLFLDTISNVFGGIIFVALLVVLLLQLTPLTAGNPAAPSDPAAAPADAALEAQIEALERITGADDAATRAELVSLLNRQGELRQAVAAERQRIESLRAREADARRAAAAAEAERHRAAQDLAAARAELEQARAQTAGRLRVPQFRATGKRETALLVAAGRVAPLLAPDGTINAADVETVPPESRVRLKPGAGEPISPDNVADLVRRLAPADSSAGYVSLAVWPDAFPQAVLLRDALIARGIDYNLLLLPRDGAVKTAASSGVQ